MVRIFTENTVEDAALTWLESGSYTAKRGSLLPTGEYAAARQDYGRMVLEDRLRETLLPKLISGDLRVKGADVVPDL